MSLHRCSLDRPSSLSKRWTPNAQKAKGVVETNLPGSQKHIKGVTRCRDIAEDARQLRYHARGSLLLSRFAGLFINPMYCCNTTCPTRQNSILAKQEVRSASIGVSLELLNRCTLPTPFLALEYFSPFDVFCYYTTETSILILLLLLTGGAGLCNQPARRRAEGVCVVCTALVSLKYYSHTTITGIYLY